MLIILFREMDDSPEALKEAMDMLSVLQESRKARILVNEAVPIGGSMKEGKGFDKKSKSYRIPRGAGARS
jgi:hypothetical protein